LEPTFVVTVYVYGVVERKVHHITIIIVIYVPISTAIYAITRAEKNVFSFLPQISNLLRGAYVVAVKATLVGSLVTHFRVILDKTLAALDIDVSMVTVLEIPVSPKDEAESLHSPKGLLIKSSTCSGRASSRPSWNCQHYQPCNIKYDRLLAR
jgi:hypothetical protein